jgi:uncharacterized protein (UPF0276 family)
VIGLAYQLRMDSWIERGRFTPATVEVTAEPFYKTTLHRLHWLAARCPVSMRCTSLSLGGFDPLDDWRLGRCADIARAANARWVSHPLGFSRAGEIDLGVTVPIPLTAETMHRVSDRVGAMMDRCGCPVALANSTSPLRIRGTLAEPDFLNALCASTGCKLTIDLSALDAECHRHRLDGAAWLDAIDARAVVQMRIDITPSGAGGTDGASRAQLIYGYAARLLERARDAVIVLAPTASCSLDVVERAWSDLRALIAPGADARSGWSS